MVSTVSRRRALASTLAFGLVATLGCSEGGRTAPETINGKTPAEYREAAEQNITSGLPVTPGKGAPKKR
jgi:hypothetical protein